MVWLFVSTYKKTNKKMTDLAREMLEEMQERSMYAIESPSTEAFLGHLLFSEYDPRISLLFSPPSPVLDENLEGTTCTTWRLRRHLIFSFPPLPPRLALLSPLLPSPNMRTTQALLDRRWSLRARSPDPYHHHPETPTTNPKSDRKGVQHSTPPRILFFLPRSPPDPPYRLHAPSEVGRGGCGGRLTLHEAGIFLKLSSSIRISYLLQRYYF